MHWNRQHPECPDFRYDAAALQPLEIRFRQTSGFLIGTVKHLEEAEREQLTVEI